MTKFAEVRVGSDSDLPKLELLFQKLNELKIPYIQRILSAHRTPGQMAKAAKEFPEVFMPHVSKSLDQTQMNIKLCFAAAGGSAHIAGMTASETNIPVIALPIDGSAMGKIDATFSMINMPPGIPNGFIADYAQAAQLAQHIMNLTAEDSKSVYISEFMQKDEALQRLIQEFGIEVTKEMGKAKIGIHEQIIDDGQIEQSKDYGSLIPVVIPWLESKVELQFSKLEMVTNNTQKINGLSMGIQVAGKINYSNAFLYCMKLMALHNPEIDAKLIGYSKRLANEVIKKDINLVSKQVDEGKFDDIMDVVLPERYTHLHGGKVRETYQHPDHPDQLIMIATDRISTHDVVHRNRIPGKGAALTQISNFWFGYFKTQDATKDIPTQQILDAELPADFPEHLKAQAIIVKKLNPLPVEAIVRGYLYGSAYKDKNGNGYNSETGKLLTGEDVGKGLTKCSKFPEPLFTPSTKDVNDTNINFDNMSEEIKKYLKINNPELINRAQEYAEQVKDYSLKMFEAAAKYTDSKDIVLADTKFEFALDDNGILHIIDEVCTPDSSRFWAKGSVKEGEEPLSFDKQDTRDYVIENWNKNGKKNTPVNISDEAIAATQERYNTMKELFVS